MKKGIVLENVSFNYKDSTLQLQNISFIIPQGGFYGITGVNGSGKTTLTFLLNGLIPHERQGQFSGNVLIDGINTRNKSVSYFARKVGMLFQNPDFMLFNLTVFEEIAFGLKNFKLGSQEERIKKALDMVGLSGFEERDPQTLSFGEKQKVALACILALDTEHIVLDEPVAMLDYRGAVNLYQILDFLNKKAGKTIIVVEHDTDFLLAYAKHVLIINQGKIILNGDSKSVFSKTKELEQIGIKVPHKTI